jgi:electron transfer flavoprotein beta subunit
VEIAVLLKQVPATESLIEIADDGTAIKTDGINWVMNPYDEMAVEEALQIRAAAGGAVTVFSMGPEKAVEALRTALAMGADTAVRIDPGRQACWTAWPPPSAGRRTEKGCFRPDHRRPPGRG